MAQKFTIMLGLPRSGKTTEARRLSALGDGAIVCPDDIRLALHGGAYNQLAEPYVWATAETMARALLIGGQSVIIDATNTTEKRRAPWLKLAKECGIKPHLIEVRAPLDICHARNNEQLEKRLSPDVIDRMADQWEPVYYSDEYDLTVAVMNVAYNGGEGA